MDAPHSAESFARETSGAALGDRKERNEMPAPLAPLGTALRQNKLMVLDDVARSEIRWLVPDLIPLGSITVMDGQKGGP
jgi:hypothetical protein